jgi:hypothetical protein
MAQSYRNRRGADYRFYPKTTKTGKTTYTASKAEKLGALEALPKGYEVYENHNAQVFLRRIEGQLITLTEVETVREIVRRQPDVGPFWVDRNKDAIIVSTGGTHSDSNKFLVSVMGIHRSQAVAEFMMQNATLMPMMRFVLADERARPFQVQRYCFRGSIDDWIDIGDEPPSALSPLARKYCSYLTSEDFYELF